MIRRLIAIALLLAPLTLSAEKPEHWAAAGVQFTGYSSPAINGLLAYARRIAGQDRPTYSYTAVQFTSADQQPFRLMATTETGLATYLFRFRGVDVFGLATAGLASAGSASGTNVGYSVTGGFIGLVGISKGVSIGPYYRVLKSSLSGAQHAVGMLIGIGDR